MAKVTEKECRVCKAIKYTADLDKTGRCFSCADAKAATDAGLTYGEYKSRQSRGADCDSEIEVHLPVPKKMEKTECCLNCGGIVPNGSLYEKFCCRDCHAAWEKREREARERGAIKEPPPRTERPPHFCPQCGKPVPGKKVYCDEKCKYLFNREKIQKKCAERSARIAAARPANLCRTCGKEIRGSNRSAYCSPECARIGRNAKRRKKNKEENTEVMAHGGAETGQGGTE